eukprot:2689225-Prymnesium_polylepis.1
MQLPHVAGLPLLERAEPCAICGFGERFRHTRENQGVAAPCSLCLAAVGLCPRAPVNANLQRWQSGGLSPPCCLARAWP